MEYTPTDRPSMEEVLEKLEEIKAELVPTCTMIMITDFYLLYSHMLLKNVAKHHTDQK